MAIWSQPARSVRPAPLTIRNWSDGSRRRWAGEVRQRRRFYSAATNCCARHWPRKARSEAGFTGLLRIARVSSRAAARTCELRSAVIRAAAGGSVDRDAVVEHTRQPFDDRQAETEAAGDPGALFQAVKFLEDLAALGHGNTDAGVVDADLQRLSVAAATDQHAPARGIFDGVRDEVLQQPAQQRAGGW